ncbi:MAG TPA: DUF3443 family protein [Candidatus Eisenbacteria bacterium]|nr:DUF3443 family protein [Candidatus Eisenbacteria bacterium]
MAACGGGGSSSSTITAITVSCSPTSVQSGQTSQCTATVTGTGTYNPGVSWGTSAGSIDNNGVFTAQDVTSSTMVTVTATSIQDTTKTASATITVAPVTAITVTCTPSIVQSRQNSQCNAFANGSPTSAVNWSSTIGVVSASGTFTAPQVTASTQATITATTKINGVAGSATVTVNVNNTATLAVDGGPSVNGASIAYPNGAYTSVTVCVPGTTTCATVDHVLVDTGSVGFRVLSSALGSVALPGQTASDGNPLAECYIAPSGYAWGPVALADVQVTGEIASSLPVQVIAPTGFSTVPAACTAQTTGGALSTISALKAKGILGIGVLLQDCGSLCVLGPQPTYFSCPQAGCAPILVPLAQQVTNPVSLFPNDNNGSQIAFPPVSAGGSATAQGTLIFGIGTQPNNGLAGATVYGVSAVGSTAATFNSTFNSVVYPGAVSSGANADYFLTSAITGFPACTTPGYYCPGSQQTVSVTNTGTNGTSGTVTLTVDNGDSLISSGNFAFSSLAGPGGTRTSGFIFGMPFFYGRTVFTALSGASTPGGTGPYFAY